MNRVSRISPAGPSRWRVLLLAGLGLAAGLWLSQPADSFGLQSPQEPGRNDSGPNSRWSLIGDQDPSFRPPNNGQKHKILVIDSQIWGFIVARGDNPAHFLSQTPYKLDQGDWAVWGRPIENGIDRFYTLMIVRRGPADAPPEPERWLTKPTAGGTSRRDAGITANRRNYWRSLAGLFPAGRDWDFRRPPRYQLINAVRMVPQETVYQPDLDLEGGQTAVKDYGIPGVDHEFQVLTTIDGIAVDKQAVGGWTIRPPRPVVVAIGVNYSKLESIPEWQRPILAQLAGTAPEDWEYVDYIMFRESTWRPVLRNKSSGAYGLCQSLPAQKMATAGDDYLTNALTQLEWCHDYAQQRYGGWSQAYDFWIRNYWW